MDSKAQRALELLSELRETIAVLGDFIEGFEMGPNGVDHAIPRYKWSRAPGKFVDKVTGEIQFGGSFAGPVREWYETLIEVIIDVHNVIRRIHPNDLDQVALIVSPEIGLIIESSVLYKPDLSSSGETSGSIVNRIRVKSCQEMKRNEAHFVHRPLMWSEPSRLLGTISVLDMVTE